jgi:hypothetical protein
MVYYQVLAQLTFYRHKPALVSTHIKKTKRQGVSGWRLHI